MTAVSRRELLQTGASLAVRILGPRSTRSFWIFKLLKPSSVVVYPLGRARLHCESASGSSIVEPSESLIVRAGSERIRISGSGGEPVHCLLEAPNVMQRRYFGTFEFFGDGESVIPVVTMDCETATASIVPAELATSTAPYASLAAQAVVSRSVLWGTAKAQHDVADFCDTTHCQFLRSPGVPGSDAIRAVRETQGIVLFSRGSILPGRYSAACGGRTDAMTDGKYEYVSVACEICRSHGIPRRGHGWGLCQEGAMGLARLGHSWRSIVQRFYPNATVRSV